MEREGARAEVTQITENGWIGFTDHYWMTTLIPEPGQSFTSVAKYVAVSTQEAALVASGTYALRLQGGPDLDRANYSLSVGSAGDFYAMGVFSYWLGGQAPFPFLGGCV